MSKSAKSLLCAALALLGAASLCAQPAPKIVVLDLSRVFDEYYETYVQRDRIAGLEADLGRDVESIRRELADLEKQYNEAAAKFNDPTLTPAAKTDIQNRVRELVGRVQAKQQDGQQLVNSTRERSARTFEVYKEATIGVITKAATEIAQQKGANMLLDKSANTMYRTSTFLWLDSAYDDITEAVLKKLNAGHEKEVEAAKKAAEAAMKKTTDTPAAPSTLPTLPPLPKAP